VLPSSRLTVAFPVGECVHAVKSNEATVSTANVEDRHEERPTRRLVQERLTVFLNRDEREAFLADVADFVPAGETARADSSSGQSTSELAPVEHRETLSGSHRGVKKRRT
jgi:hypothetical protein